MRKYSENFERDYNFYLNNIGNYKFCGTLMPKHTAIYSDVGKSAKEVFYLIDSTGKNHPTNEPKLLNDLLLCKASVNFHIKQWAEGRADETLTFEEFAGDGETLEWRVDVVRNKYFWWMPTWMKKIFGLLDKKIPIPIYGSSMAKRYGFPSWVVDAVEKQKEKLLNNAKV